MTWEVKFTHTLDIFHLLPIFAEGTADTFNHDNTRILVNINTPDYLEGKQVWVKINQLIHAIPTSNHNLNCPKRIN